jgi:regulation of enolase protein 1 (concanavalin A-like superfamily)
MIRLTLDPDSPHVVLDVKPDGGIEFMTRATPGGETTFVAGGVFNGDACGLRLIRSAGVVTAVVCKLINGFVTSQTLGSVPFPTGMALAGAVVTSHDPSTLSHGMFPASPPVVSTVPPPWYPTPVGAVGLTGDAFTENGTFTVRGAGSDIWGTSDSFQLVRNFMTGDGDIIARVTSEQAANTFAKAGVVLAGTFDNPSSAAVILDVRPNGVIEFMARPTDGGSMMFVAGSAASFPVWLKLKRSGDQFTGFVSSEGHNWQVVGMTTVVMRHDVSITRTAMGAETHWIGGLSPTSFPIWLKLTRSGTVVTAWASSDGANWTNLTQASLDISSDALIGIAVTSHVRGVLTTATFDSISR